jgi:hypothetical protein
LAGAKLPSRKASSHFNRPLASRAPSKARQALSQMPSLPTASGAASGWMAKDTRREETAMLPPSAAPTECPQNRPVLCPRTASVVLSAPWLRKQRTDQLPLPVAQQLLPLLHDRSSTVHPPQT